MTERYVVVPEQPWVLGHFPTVVLQHLILGNPIGSTMFWDKNSPLRFNVLDKEWSENIEEQFLNSDAEDVANLGMKRR